MKNSNKKSSKKSYADQINQSNNSMKKFFMIDSVIAIALTIAVQSGLISF